MPSRHGVIRGQVRDCAGRERGRRARRSIDGGCGVYIKMPTGKLQDLPPPPTTQAEVLRSPFRKTFEYSQRVEVNGLLDVGCFAPIEKQKAPKGRNIVSSKWMHTDIKDKQGYLKKNQNAPRPSEHPPVRGGKMSKRLCGTKGCKDRTCAKTESWLVAKEFSQVAGVDYNEFSDASRGRCKSDSRAR